MVYFINAMESIAITPFITVIAKEHLRGLNIIVDKYQYSLDICCQEKTLFPHKVLDLKGNILFETETDSDIASARFKNGDRFIKDNGRHVFTTLTPIKYSNLYKKVTASIASEFPNGYTDIIKILEGPYGIRSFNEYQLVTEPNTINDFLSAINSNPDKLHFVKSSLYPHNIKQVTKKIKNLKVINIIRNPYMDFIFSQEDDIYEKIPHPRTEDKVSYLFIDNLIQSLLLSNDKELDVYTIRHEDVIAKQEFTIDKTYSVPVGGHGSYIADYDLINLSNISDKGNISRALESLPSIDKIDALENIFTDIDNIKLDMMSDSGPAFWNDARVNRYKKMLKSDVILPPMLYVDKDNKEEENYTNISDKMMDSYEISKPKIKALKDAGITFSSYYKYPKIDLRKIIYNSVK